MIKYLDDFARMRKREIEEMSPALDEALSVILELEAAFKGSLFLTGSRFFRAKSDKWTDVDYYISTSDKMLAWLFANGFNDITQEYATDMSVNYVYELRIRREQYCTVLLIDPKMITAKHNAQKRIQDTLDKGQIEYLNINWMTWNALISTELGVLVAPKPHPILAFLKRII
jgi:hypothetical protein